MKSYLVAFLNTPPHTALQPGIGKNTFHVPQGFGWIWAKAKSPSTETGAGPASPGQTSPPKGLRARMDVRRVDQLGKPALQRRQTKKGVGAPDGRGAAPVLPVAPALRKEGCFRSARHPEKPDSMGLEPAQVGHLSRCPWQLRIVGESSLGPPPEGQAHGPVQFKGVSPVPDRCPQESACHPRLPTGGRAHESHCTDGQMEAQGHGAARQLPQGSWTGCVSPPPPGVIGRICPSPSVPHVGTVLR